MLMTGNSLCSGDGQMFKNLNNYETYILIPGMKKFHAISLQTGIKKSFSQAKDGSEKICNIMIRENGRNHLLFRIENRELTFFVTSKCNHRCIMCPQALNIDPINNEIILQYVIDNLDYDVIDEICFTGGEPFLKMNFVEQVVQKAPERIKITILTNGTIIPSVSILKSLRCKLCVPLYAPYDELHNKMTGSSSFYKVVENLIKISQYDTLIELRFVVTRLNYSCLEEFARFAWRNLPFVQDVAFMGMELTAEALNNKEELWCNPKDYIPSLQKAVSYLNTCGVTAWIYNLPLCLFDEQYRRFVVKSISPWKVKYIQKCDTCNLKNNCGGMFFSDASEFEKDVLQSL